MKCFQLLIFFVKKLAKKVARISDSTTVCAVSSTGTFLLGAVGGVIAGALIMYCSNCKGRRGKLDLIPPAGPQYEDVTCAAPPAPLYQDILVPQLELKENVAYGKVETGYHYGHFLYKLARY